METWIQTVLAGVGLSIFSWLLTRLIRDFDSTKSELKKHVEDCNRIPKSTVLEKIENLCEKTDEYQLENTKRFDKVDTHVENMYTRLNKNEIAVARLEVSHGKRD